MEKPCPKKQKWCRGRVEKWLRGSELKEALTRAVLAALAKDLGWVQFLAPTSGSSQTPVTPGLANLVPSSSTAHRHLQACGEHTKKKGGGQIT